jgi:hypothetical protein
MIIGAIIPAMGSAFVVIALGFINLSESAGTTILIALIASLMVTQLFFILMFKSLKPQSMA